MVRRPEDWLGVPAAGAVILLSFALAVRILDAGSGSAETTPLPTPAPGAQRGTIASPLARDPETLMLARHSREVLIGLAARRGGPVDVLVSDGESPLPAASLRATITGRTVRVVEPTPCGNGCFRLDAQVLTGSPVTIAVEALRGGKTTALASFRLPARLPPPGSRLLRTVNRTMGALRTVTVRERLSSGRAVLRARFAMRAPDRLRVDTSDGGKTVLIGTQRWDWVDGRWQRGPAPQARLPTYSWEGATYARLLGRARVASVPVQVLGLFNPARGPSWFRLFVGPDSRVRRAEMLAPSHFMIDDYAGFNRPVVVKPPA